MLILREDKKTGDLVLIDGDCASIDILDLQLVYLPGGNISCDLFVRMVPGEKYTAPEG